MGCILAFLMMLAPRVVMVFIFLMTTWFQRAYETMVWPVLGFIFMPYLTLAYMAMKLQNGTLTGGWLVLVIVTAVIDVMHWGGTGRHYRRWRD
jgi:hypothetical protein